jgi:hypothetical protein
MQSSFAMGDNSLVLSSQVPMCQTWAIIQVITYTLLLVVKQCVLNQF